jgi:hypothetical protein
MGGGSERPWDAQPSSVSHVNGCVNRHNCRIWGSEQPNEIHEYVRGSAKVNVWCGLLCDRLVGPFFFTESTITGDIYLELLQLFFPTNWRRGEPACARSLEREVRQRLDWEGRTNSLASQKPRSYPAGLFFLWGYVKNCVYGEKIGDLQNLRDRIATVTPDIIQRTWHEIEYRLDVCRTTNVAHIETY